MPKPMDLTNQKFGRLTVVKKTFSSKHRQSNWECLCECGTQKIVLQQSLIRGLTKSCGCLRNETSRINKLTHGMADTPEYRIWCGMIQRCTNPGNPAFKDYGGRGITICREWEESFMEFYNFMGKRPSPKHSVERINNDDGYTPSNVKWARRKEQNNNSRHNHIITINGKQNTLTQWATISGINPKTLIHRLKAGWKPFDAVFKPVRHCRSHIKSIPLVS